jgi:hypothetical protein
MCESVIVQLQHCRCHTLSIGFSHLIFDTTSLCVLVSGVPMERQDRLGMLCTWVSVSGFHNVTEDKRVNNLL